MNTFMMKMMNAKRTIQMAAMLAVTAVLLVSCTNERTTHYRMTFSPDLIETCDVTVIYKGQNGVEMTEGVTDTLWEKSINNDTLPLLFGLDYKIQPKQGLKPQREQLDLKASCFIQLSLDKDILFTNTSDSLIYCLVPATRLDSAIQADATKHPGPFHFLAKKDGVWDLE